MKIAATFGFLLLSSALVLVHSVRADAIHSPGEGTAERKAILAALHKEYTTGSGSGVSAGSCERSALQAK